ncbi:MAG: hypothetical protein OXG51_00475 [Gammaproteobacteria bacterium]|nr:hypothetical protein [Gammaproteobacteria bacterium]
MSFGEWFSYLAAAFGGGLVVKFLDIVYQEFRRRSDQSQSARRLVNQNLGPVLKAADELVGKLRSLADSDFKSLRNVDPKADRIENHDFSSLLFLLAKLWANIEMFRREGLSISVVGDARGRRFQSFMDCIESRRVRIVDRISQRAVAELMLNSDDGSRETCSFIEFVRRIETDPEAQRWVEPVIHVLSRTLHTSVRQRLLQYGAVIHAMIDTLDPDHQVTRSRPSYPNKLSKRSRQGLKYRVFGVYLKFIPEPEKYLGPPKGSPKQRNRRREGTLAPLQERHIRCAAFIRLMRHFASRNQR